MEHNILEVSLSLAKPLIPFALKWVSDRYQAAQKRRDTSPGTHYKNIKSDLLKSHDELRAVLRLAAIELRKRSIGRRDSTLLQLMRQTLREARAVAKVESSKTAAAKNASAG
jgi:hypothetical protein